MCNKTVMSSIINTYTQKVLTYAVYLYNHVHMEETGISLTGLHEVTRGDK